MAKQFAGLGATIIDTVADLPSASASLEGLMYYQKDTNELKICDGAGWISVIDTDTPPAMQLINPTSVAGGSNTNGTVSFSASAGCRIKGVFSSAYDNYRVLIRITGSSTAGSSLYMRFSQGDTDLTSGTYYYAGNWVKVNNTSGLWYAAGQTFIHLGYCWNARSTVSMDVHGSYTSLPKNVLWQSWGDDNSAQIAVNAAGSSIENSTLYDGFVIYPSTGTFYGTVRVYGYRNSI